MSCASQLRNPAGKGIETFLDKNSLQTVPAQLGAHAQRSLAPRGMIGHEVLRVTPVIEQFLVAQRVEQRCDDRCIVTLLVQFTA